VIINNRNACVKHVLAKGQIQYNYVQNVQCTKCMTLNILSLTSNISPTKCDVFICHIEDSTKVVVIKIYI